jgi:competence protein ComEA
MPPLPLSRRQLLMAAAAVLVLLVVLGRLLARQGTASSTPAPLAPRPAAAAAPSPRLVVQVVGAVRRPGLYRLPQGARVANAVARAGGPTRRADVALVNLAAPVADGTQVVVPLRMGGSAPGVAVPSGGAGPAGTSGPVHLNSATLEQLDALPGVGPVTAQKILDYRKDHGTFHSVDDLDAVSGIGPARLDQLRDLVAP